MRVVIVGGGMGGLFTALALRESGQFSEVNVYERSASALEGYGAGIVARGCEQKRVTQRVFILVAAG